MGTGDVKRDIRAIDYFIERTDPADKPRLKALTRDRDERLERLDSLDRLAPDAALQAWHHSLGDRVLEQEVLQAFAEPDALFIVPKAPELQAALAALGIPREAYLRGTQCDAYPAVVMRRDGTLCRIILAEISEQGHSQATNFVNGVWARFKASRVFLVGMAAGTAMNKGDVTVPRVVTYVGGGRDEVDSKTGERYTSPRPDPIPAISDGARREARRIDPSRPEFVAWFKQLVAATPDRLKPKGLNSEWFPNLVKAGESHMVADDPLTADGSLARRQSEDDDLIRIQEMESYGFCIALRSLNSAEGVEFAVYRGVADYGEPGDKGSDVPNSKEWQYLAALAAASFAIEALREPVREIAF